MQRATITALGTEPTPSFIDLESPCLSRVRTLKNLGPPPGTADRVQLAKKTPHWWPKKTTPKSTAKLFGLVGPNGPSANAG